MLLVVGALIGVYVRPQELLLFMAAFAVAGLFRPRNTQRSFRGIRRLSVMALQAVLLLAAVSLSQQLAKHAPVFNLNQLAKNNVGQASSLHYHPGPAGYPKDIYTVLFDPLPFNAHGSTQRLAAFENTVIIFLFLTSFRRFWHLGRACFTRPYVLMCVMYSVSFPYAFAALNNLGLIDRERVLLLPFLLVPLCIPLTPRGQPPMYPWEYSQGRQKRKAKQTRWGASPVPGASLARADASPHRRGGGAVVLCVQPRLEHEHVPQGVLPVVAAREVLGPQPAHDTRGQVAVGPEPARVEEVLGPRPQRAAQPVAEGDAEPGLGPLHQGGRDVAVQETTQEPLARARPHLHVGGGATPGWRRRDRGRACGPRGSRPWWPCPPW